MTSSEKYERHVAYHEAGHAIMGAHFGLEVDHIRLDFVSGPSVAAVEVAQPGRIVGYHLDGRPVRLTARKAALIEILVSLAGVAAEGEFFGEMCAGGHRSDFDTAIEHAIKIAKGDLEKYLNSKLAEAARIIKQRRNTVEAVALALLTAGSLNHDQFVAIYQNEGEA